MRSVLALACILIFTVVADAHFGRTQARKAVQNVAERTVVLSVRGMT
jgi:predicted kinase